MTLLHPKVEPTEVNEPDAEALIREARRLRRRRWMLGCLVVVLVTGGIVAGLIASGGTGSCTTDDPRLPCWRADGRREGIRRRG